MKLYVDSMDWWLNGVKAIVLSNWDFGRCNLEGRRIQVKFIYFILLLRIRLVYMVNNSLEE